MNKAAMSTLMSSGWILPVENATPPEEIKPIAPEIDTTTGLEINPKDESMEDVLRGLPKIAA